ncbi:MAG: sigma-54-dependent Fis family transcriptional regulator [Alphaproteobacteria bacterium]|nr:sigma-54-dependent Fis family transcriptional regulator [Alphaproteobacteria bacterium]
MKLLIVGMLEGHMATAGDIALKRGARVISASDTARALGVLRTDGDVDVVMADVRTDVPALISAMEREHIAAPVIACGIDATDAAGAVAAIQAGAKEYIPLPPDAKLIAAVFEAIAEESQAYIYEDQKMHDLIAQADRIAASSASVLILGESGTGKEGLARHLHQQSNRAQQSFIAVNCAAIPENLLESELFGHEKGAFTGATARRIGKFEAAHGGTLLLDEIGEMAKHLQAKLLRAIQEREIDRVGGNVPVKVDVRLLATSNRVLFEEVEAGNFRQDLYYRLNVVTLILPALRERVGDIPKLADYFAKHYAEDNGVAYRPFSKEAREKLVAYSWPGNVRELENTVHRSVLFSQGQYLDANSILLNPKQFKASEPQADTSELPGTSADTVKMHLGSGVLVGRTVDDVERELILNTLDQYTGNRTQAAKILGISIRTLRNKLKKYTEEGFAICGE